MNENLYFIPIIAEALQQEDTEEALEQAFEQIESLGRQRRYETGYEQFAQLMDTVGVHIDKSKVEEPEIEFLSERPPGIGISLFRDNEPFKSVTFTKIPDAKTIDGIRAGYYRLTLATGRLVWEGELSERDLIWVDAFEGRPLEMAADTGGAKASPTRQISALGGDVEIRVFAGIESGRIEVVMNASGGQ